MENQLTDLREFITAHYDLDELRTLCFDLGINYDELRGQTLSGKASALILHVGQRNDLERLLAVLQGSRPDDVPALDVAALYAGLPAFEEGVFPPSLWERFRRRRLLFYASLLLASLVVLIVVLAGLISIGADIGGAREQLREMGMLPTFTPTATPTPTPAPTSTPTPTPTPLPFPPADADENLIVIAALHRSEGVVDTDAHNEIRRAIQAAAAELDFAHLRVEVEPTPLTADDQAGAEGLGRRYGASMVIWGADTGVRVSVSFLNLRQPDFDAAQVQISETERTQLAAPDAYAKFITTDLPGQLTFLSLFAIGQSYYSEEDYAKSVAVIEKAVDSLTLEAGPLQGLADAHFRLGWLYQVLDDAERALTNYDMAIQLDPDFAAAYYNRGNARYDQGDPGGAIADYDKAIQLDPHYAWAYHNRGVARRDQGDLAGAITDLDQAIHFDPDDALAYHNRGIAHAELGDLASAIADFDKAIELDPDEALAYYNRGVGHKLQGDLEGAIADYDQAIQLDPDLAETYGGRGMAHREIGNAAAALADFRRYLELRPDAENRATFEEWIAELEAQLSAP